MDLNNGMTEIFHFVQNDIYSLAPLRHFVWA